MASLEQVSKKQGEWAALGAAEKLSLLKQCKANLQLVVEEWVRLDCTQKGYDVSNPEHAHLVAEAYMYGPGLVGSWLHSLISLYEGLTHKGAVPDCGSPVMRSDGSSSYQVFPKGFREKFKEYIWRGITGHVVCEDNGEQVNPLSLEGGMSVVLGTSCYSAPLDCLSALFLENKVVCYKCHPILKQSLEAVTVMFRPLIDHGPFITLVDGDHQLGQQLLTDPLTTHGMMTGTSATYNSIMWGNGDVRTESPALTIPFKAQLGGVNPYIICPSNWTRAQLKAQAHQLVASKMLSGGQACTAPQVVLMSREWPQRTEFMNLVTQLLQNHPPSRVFQEPSLAFYHYHTVTSSPCTSKVVDGIKNENLFGGDQCAPRVFRDVKINSCSLTHEARSPILAEVCVDHTDMQGFLDQAVEICNNKINGSLTATVVVHPSTLAKHAKAVDVMIDQLNFGTVTVNCTSLGLMMAQLPWGAFPGHTIENIGSGMGHIGNTCCLSKVKKAVIRAPFVFATQMQVPVDKQVSLRNAKLMTHYLCNQSFTNFVRVAFTG